MAARLVLYLHLVEPLLDPSAEVSRLRPTASVSLAAAPASAQEAARGLLRRRLKGCSYVAPAYDQSQESLLPLKETPFSSAWP